MVATSEVMDVCAMIFPDGGVGFTLADQASTETLHQEWRNHVGGVKVQMYLDKGTVGGWIKIKMLSAEFHAMAKHRWIESEDRGLKEFENRRIKV